MKHCVKCGCRVSSRNKSGFCKKCFGRFVLSPAGAAANRLSDRKSVYNCLRIFGDNKDTVRLDDKKEECVMETRYTVRVPDSLNQKIEQKIKQEYPQIKNVSGLVRAALNQYLD